MFAQPPPGEDVGPLLSRAGPAESHAAWRTDTWPAGSVAGRGGGQGRIFSAEQPVGGFVGIIPNDNHITHSDCSTFATLFFLFYSEISLNISPWRQRAAGTLRASPPVRAGAGLAPVS